MSPLNPAAGVSVGDRYELLSRIATGGMGEVWAARDQVLGREVAVKLLRGDHADDPTFLTRFRTEARHAASLAHPGIASVYDYGEDDGAAFLVMELVPGEPLSARLRREGALTPEVAVPLLQQAATAIAAAHAVGLVHRDVKPANLLITPDQQVKVTDFGIARLGGDDPVTRTGEVMGTAQYLSPEQALGQQATPASDVYSLGVVAYETLGGRRPFEADSAVAVAMAHVQREPEPLPLTVPTALAAVIMASLAKDPALRPASAAEFGRALGAALTGRGAASAAPTAAIGVPVTAPTPVAAPDRGDQTQVLRTSPAEPPPPEPTRRRSLGPLLLVLLAIVAVAAVVIALLSQQGDDTPGGPTPSATASTTPSQTSSPPSSTSTSSSTSASPTATTPSATTPSATSPSATTPSTSTATTPSTSGTTPADDGEVTLDPAEYVGRQVADVQAELAAQGLDTEVNRERRANVEPGTVLFLSPKGPYAVGDTVTLQVAIAVDDDGNGKTKTKTNGNGNANSPTGTGPND